MKLHQRKVFVIMTEDDDYICVGKFPNERLEAIDKLNARTAIRLFPNKVMAEEYMLRRKYWSEELKVVEVVETISTI